MVTPESQTDTTEKRERVQPPMQRILVVDDETAVREGIARALRRANERYDVHSAGDGLEAGIKIARLQPDLVLLDLVMPGMGGLETCYRIRHLSGLKDVKIIILTGYPGSGNPEKALFYGADLFLSKPQTIEALCTHIEELLEDSRP